MRGSGTEVTTSRTAHGVLGLGAVGTLRRRIGQGDVGSLPIVVGLAVRQMDVFVFSVGQFLLCGVLHMGFSLFTEPLSLPGLSSVWLPVLYAGLFSIGIGFTLQAVGQKKAPASDAALILSLEAVFAAIGGYFILGEKLSPIQILGAVIIFVSISIAQMLQLLRKPVEATAMTQEVPTDFVS